MERKLNIPVFETDEDGSVSYEFAPGAFVYIDKMPEVPAFGVGLGGGFYEVFDTVFEARLWVMENVGFLKREMGVRD